MAVLTKVSALDKKLVKLRELMARASAEQLADYSYRLDVSWIYHDAAIEGIVYEPAELQAALHEGVSSDSSLIPVYDEIRCAKASIDLVREMAKAKELEITLDTIRQLYLTLSPADAEGGGPKYRKDMPLHRQYFHEIAQPDKIATGMKQAVQWIGNQEGRTGIHLVRYASKAHYKILQVFPYNKHSGRIARLIMNMILLHAGYPPVILHATDRQGYYDALRQGPDRVSTVVRTALMNDLTSTIRFFSRLLGLPDPGVQ